ncbi:hypothetical protein BDY19DRAFT_997722, partial [Irpex rosettiformis]
MAGTGRPRGRPPSRGRGGGRGAKTASTRKRVQVHLYHYVFFLSDIKASTRKATPEEQEDASSVQQSAESDQEFSAKTVSQRSRAVVKDSDEDKSTTGSTWNPIEDKSDIVDEQELDASEEEEEDELADEGESVGSDIEHLDFSPDIVAFTRPSTSPIRRRKGITTETPPSPSPTKNTKKRHASASPDVAPVNDDDEDTSEPVTPVRARKPRVKKVIKSKEIIEDSDIEEISESEHKKSVARKGKQTVVATSKPTKSIVTTLKKKIAVPGTKFPSTPIEDPDNNL